MWGLIRSLLKRLLALAAGLVILLALGIGGFRVLVTQLPSYQDDIQAWVNSALGLQLAFDRVDARWGLSGPELKFYGASVATSEQDEPVLTATEADVELSALALVFERRLTVSRLTFDGTQFTLIRNPDGTLRVQGVRMDHAGRGDLAIDDVPPVLVRVRNSEIAFVDRQRETAWEFRDVSIDLERDSDRLSLEARATTPSELGSRIELSADGQRATGKADERDWSVFAAISDARMAGLSRFLPQKAVMPVAGGGDVSVWLDMLDGRLSRATVELAARDLALESRSAGTAGRYAYDRVGFIAEWTRSEDSWQLALSDIDMRRNGRAWPVGDRVEVRLARDTEGVAGVSLRGDFLQLEDLTPIAALLPNSPIAESWSALAPQGQLRNTSVDLTRKTAGGWEYNVSSEFAALRLAPYRDWPGFSGLSGELRADSRSGRLALSSRGIGMSWPAVFARRLSADTLDGIVVWREGRTGYRVVSDNLLLSNRDATARTNLELTLPRDGSSPRLELESRLSAFDATLVKRYLPTRKLPPVVSRWLSEAIRGGSVSNGHVTFFGPLRDFPFDDGQGQFRVTADLDNGSLAYLSDWPRAEGLTGSLEFVNAGFKAAGRGRILGNVSEDVKVSIPDMRDAVLTLKGSTNGPLSDVLAFLKGAPLVARHLEPGLGRLGVEDGNGQVDLNLELPLSHREDYRLAGRLRIEHGELSIDGLAPHVTDVHGMLSLKDDEIAGEGIEGIFLDGPVTVSVASSSEPGYRASLNVDGEVTAEAAAQALSLPIAEHIGGQTQWQGRVLIPADPAGSASAPLKVSLSSNLSGVALRFPEPFDKAPAEPVSFQADLSFLDDDRLEVGGHLGATRRFVLGFSHDRRGFEFRRGELRFGGAFPVLPEQDGLRIEGRLPALHWDDWLALPGSTEGASTIGRVLLGGEMQVADFSAFGQQLGKTYLVVSKEPSAWRIGVDSEAIAGELEVPRGAGERPQIDANMQRLYLSSGRVIQGADADPRRLPGIELQAAEFGVGARHFGRLEADIQADPLGLRLVSFDTVSDSFSTEGSGAWFLDGQGQTTRLALTLSSREVARTLTALGFDPVVEGKSAEVTASVYWPGGPSSQWMRQLNGDAAIQVHDGSVLDLEPGAGRVMGLMSITALPRRLALDFRDVFNKGLVFDDVAGDFTIIDGNAYTNDLKLTGPVTEIGVVGRTGLRDRDYQQQVVVTAEPGRMLPAVGGLIAGPGVGAALLIFTQIFKEPLKGIGRASYCVTGTWDQPSIERLSAEELQKGRLCADLPPEGLTMLQQQ